MPRVTSNHQLGRRDLLVVCWRYIPELIGLLESTAQWELHRYYRPSIELLDDDFITHMKQVRLSDASLAQRASRHYNLIFRTFKRYADQVGKYNWEEIRRLVVRDSQRVGAASLTGRVVVAHPLVRPEIDVVKLVSALKALADEDGKKAA